jgi:hypothetical protein
MATAQVINGAFGFCCLALQCRECIERVFSHAQVINGAFGFCCLALQCRECIERVFPQKKMVAAVSEMDGSCCVLLPTPEVCRTRYHTTPESDIHGQPLFGQITDGLMVEERAAVGSQRLHTGGN